MNGARETATEGSVSTYLNPDAGFPADLSELGLVELQVLHSRLARQLDQEYLSDPEGPHPVTQDRTEQVLVELMAREARVSVVADMDREPVIDLSGAESPAVTSSVEGPDDLRVSEGLGRD